MWRQRSCRHRNGQRAADLKDPELKRQCRFRTVRYDLLANAWAHRCTRSLTAAIDGLAIFGERYLKNCGGPSSLSLASSPYEPVAREAFSLFKLSIRAILRPGSQIERHIVDPSAYFVLLRRLPRLQTTLDSIQRRRRDAQWLAILCFQSYIHLTDKGTPLPYPPSPP